MKVGVAKKVHPYAWLWEPLEAEPSFVLRSMFGTKCVYLDGMLRLAFAAKNEPWRGVLVGTDRDRQPALVAQFPNLHPHVILPKWLYLAESEDAFENTAAQLVRLVRARDERIGVHPSPPKRSSARRSRLERPR